MDTRLRHTIFKEVLGPSGILRRKTRIVVLNDYSFLGYVDRLILMQGRTISDTGTLEELKMRHDLSAECWYFHDDEEIDENVSDHTRLRPVMKRQDTMKTRDILQTMKSKAFDNVDDMAFDSVTVDNYAFFAKQLGYRSISAAGLTFLLSQALEVLYKMWLANWTSVKAHPLQAAEEAEESHFVLVFGLLGFAQAFTYLIALVQANLQTVSASSRIHKETFHRVLHSTIDFVWSNPVGAIANRFSRDMNETDVTLPNTLKNFVIQVRV